jgi:hypothetical protein
MIRRRTNTNQASFQTIAVMPQTNAVKTILASPVPMMRGATATAQGAVRLVMPRLHLQPPIQKTLPPSFLALLCKGKRFTSLSTCPKPFIYPFGSRPN